MSSRSILCLLAVFLSIGCNDGGTELVASPSGSDAEFIALGDLSGGAYHSYANSVSQGGSVVVGASQSSSGTQAFRWTATGGMVGLGDLSGGSYFSEASSVSSDGNVVVGSSESADGMQAFRWTAGAGMVGIGDLSGGAFMSRAYAVSLNGAWVAGRSASANGEEAFIWSSQTGMVGLGFLSGGSWSQVWAVNNSGTLAFGISETSAGFEAFVWTSSGGMQGLGYLEGGDTAAYSVPCAEMGDTIALAIAVGGSTSADSGSWPEAFIWTEEDGMVGLGDLAGGDFGSLANSVSANGSVVVGEALTGAPSPPTAIGTEAFYWTPSSKMVNLKSMLTTAHGLDLTGWILENAQDVSPNGKAIVGWAFNPSGNAEGYLVKLP